MANPSKIRAARRRAGLSQAELATKAGISQATLSRIERGEGDPRTNVLEEIARACGVALPELLGDDPRVTGTEG
jgi:transcriptional regulator with XRE-family HTH domain